MNGYEHTVLQISTGYVHVFSVETVLDEGEAAQKHGYVMMQKPWETWLRGLAGVLEVWEVVLQINPKSSGGAPTSKPEQSGANGYCCSATVQPFPAVTGPMPWENKLRKVNFKVKAVQTKQLVL